MEGWELILKVGNLEAKVQRLEELERTSTQHAQRLRILETEKARRDTALGLKPEPEDPGITLKRWAAYIMAGLAVVAGIAAGIAKALGVV